MPSSIIRVRSVARRRASGKFGHSGRAGKQGQDQGNVAGSAVGWRAGRRRGDQQQVGHRREQGRDSASRIQARRRRPVLSRASLREAGRHRQAAADQPDPGDRRAWPPGARG